ncbi:hypothetical protein [Mailhella sp.]|uniref:hypothetical protein n=1 Tax=Mailhella sp. TaxID=1981029 RepID=UPI0040631D8C
MLYIQREQNSARRLFGWKKEFQFPFHVLLVTLFGRTWRISFSFKGDYSFVETQMRAQLDALAQSFVAQAIELKTQKPLRSFVRLSTGGKSTDFYFKGDLDGTPIFVKTALTGWKQELDEGDTVLSNEYRKGRMAAALSPHFVEPLYWFNGFPCEILIFPFLKGARTLFEVAPKNEEEYEGLASQVRAIQNFLKTHGLVHRDIQETNFLFGSLNGQEPSLFLVDLTFMKRADGDDELPPALDRAFLRIVRRKDDEGAFEAILERLKARMQTR